MIVRSLDDVAPVEWGNGLSTRLLTASDAMGFALADTRVRRGTTSALQYRNHLEACYCVSGSGEVVEKHGKRHKITPGTLYALNEHDPHYLVASDDEDLHLVSIWNPPINGDEKHTLSEDGFSQY